MNQMKKILKPFQSIGADFLCQHPHALLADEMGLGKTVTALAAIESIDAREILVICPASVRTNWMQEWNECGMDTSLTRKAGRKRCMTVMSYNGAVSSYRAPDLSLCGPFDVIILDEAHFLKTADSQRTQAIFGNDRGLARRAHYKWGLTGTPVLNRPRELYPILKTLAGKLITPYNTPASFDQRYCGAYFDGRGINNKGASHMDELAAKLTTFMLRRTKAEVMPELPPRIISHPPLDLTLDELAPVFALESEISNREAYLSPTHEDYAQLGDLSRMLRAMGNAKIKKVAAFVEDLLDSGADKVVIFCRHRDVIRGLESELGHCCPVVYHGGMNDTQKQEAVKSFCRVADRREVFIGQIAAAGVGINGLQEVCSTVVFAELSWVPGEMAQAIDRCHRIGQTAGCVNVYMPHVPGTLESAMLQVQLAKQTVIDRLMGKAAVDLSGLEGLI